VSELLGGGSKRDAPYSYIFLYPIDTSDVSMLYLSIIQQLHELINRQWLFRSWSFSPFVDCNTARDVCNVRNW